MLKWVKRLGAIGVVAALLAAPARATSWERDDSHEPLAGTSQEMNSATPASLIGAELRHMELTEPATMMVIGAALLAAFRSRRHA
jgi:hypothetical protein